MNPVIKVKNLTKEFKLSTRKGLFNRSSKKIKALDNINFSVKQGEYIGIIGLNGAGKTTLLRVLAKILKPNQGQIYMHGKIAPFIDLGIGVDDLTVKENIELYCSLLGLDKKETKNKLDKIIKFAGLKKYIHVEYRELSLGMKGRMALSTVAYINPDIFLIDEGLSPGDKEFGDRFYNLFWKFHQQRKTLIMASHNLHLIEWYCSKTLLLHQGQQIMFGETKKVMNYYKNNIK